MPRHARLFQLPEEVIEAWQDALRRSDLDAALSLWFEEDSVSCVLPDGVRLVGHEELREGLSGILNTRPILLDTLSSISHNSMGVVFVDSTEAVRLGAEFTEPALFINMTLVLIQGTQGWQIAHLHASSVPKELVQSPSFAGDHGFH